MRFEFTGHPITGWPLTIAIMTLLAATLFAVVPSAARAEDSEEEALLGIGLSPYWPARIQRWEPEIDRISAEFGIHPDFLAAVVRSESNGLPEEVSVVGAVGLMGVMPTGPGLEWRPSSEELRDPYTNLNWGAAILVDIIHQSGGDLSAALAAYSGGWVGATRSIPQGYSAEVLDNYARAILVREGISTDISPQWTLAIQIDQGYVPQDTDDLWILGDQPVSGLYVYAPHILYEGSDPDSLYPLRIQAYVVPVAIQVVEERGNPSSDLVPVDPAVSMRMGMISPKDVEANQADPRLILACLPSINRLRGEQSTRWFAPTTCPDWHR